MSITGLCAEQQAFYERVVGCECVDRSSKWNVRSFAGEGKCYYVLGLGNEIMSEKVVQ